MDCFCACVLENYQHCQMFKSQLECKVKGMQRMFWNVLVFNSLYAISKKLNLDNTQGAVEKYVLGKCNFMAALSRRNPFFLNPQCST